MRCSPRGYRWEEPCSAAAPSKGCQFSVVLIVIIIFGFSACAPTPRIAQRDPSPGWVPLEVLGALCLPGGHAVRTDSCLVVWEITIVLAEI